MIENLKKCMICPHCCGVNRLDGMVGRCKSTDRVRIALSSLHMFEEPCISGKNGSGTVFFSNCNLSCIYCQNYEVSQEGFGKDISVEDLAKVFLEQQSKGAHNINLVTPTSYVYHIIEALDIAKNMGLNIPVIYNTNGYERVDTLELLDGYVDVYLPDLKYFSDSLAKKFSGVDNYFQVATSAIKKMYEQVGGALLDENGLIKKGVVIRHLILPNHVLNSKHVLQWINDNMPKDVFVSLMAQYFPTYLTKDCELLNRKLSKKEFDFVLKFLYSLDLPNGYIQQLGENEEQFVPNFKKSSCVD